MFFQHNHNTIEKTPTQARKRFGKKQAHFAIKIDQKRYLMVRVEDKLELTFGEELREKTWFKRSDKNGTVFPLHPCKQLARCHVDRFKV
jgi:hypothetical protein